MEFEPIKPINVDKLTDEQILKMLNNYKELGMFNPPLSDVIITE